VSRAQTSTTAALQGTTALHEAKPANAPVFALALALALALGSAPASAQQQPDAGKPAAAAPPTGSWIKESTPAPKKAKKAPPADASAQGPAKARPAPAAAAPEKKAPAPEPKAASPAPAAAAASEPLPAPPLPEAPPPALPPPAPPLITKIAPAPVASSDDFDLLAPAPVLDKAQLAQANLLEEKLATRRTMLGLHQIAGFVNLAGVATAVVLGQLNYNDKYAGGGDTEKYITAHKVAAYGSAGIFAATGLLALLAPSPIDQPTRLSTATVHKTCMAVATAGMVAQVVLGIVAASKNGSLSQRDYALAHQVIGYTTAVATAGGFIAITW
jgi:hypothetical protein